jgi:hypothetical protein
MIRQCVECEENFNSYSAEKRKAGGKANTCPSCSEESVPKVLGFSAGDGKMSSITILKFKSQTEAEAYKRYWQQNSGLNTGKNCQIGRGLMATPGISFQTVTQSTPANHKGRAV